MLTRTIQRSLHTFLLLTATLSASLCHADDNNYEVYVFYNKFCTHCKAWMESTGNTYDQEASNILGHQAPKMTKYDLSARENMKFYQDLLSNKQLSKPIPGVPAFIIVSNKKEVNRVIGAMDKPSFYRFVSETIQ